MTSRDREREREWERERERRGLQRKPPLIGSLGNTTLEISSLPVPGIAPASTKKITELAPAAMMATTTPARTTTCASAPRDGWDATKTTPGMSREDRKMAAIMAQFQMLEKSNDPAPATPAPSDINNAQREKERADRAERERERQRLERERHAKLDRERSLRAEREKLQRQQLRCPYSPLPSAPPIPYITFTRISNCIIVTLILIST